MLKNLKEKVQTEITKKNQALLSKILPNDLISIGKDSTTRTSSITSHDENNDNSRSRLDSASSDISQTASVNSNYVSPMRHFMPPSDIESEYGGDESDHEINNKIKRQLIIYKNKFEQLRNAYNEVERERDHIKNSLEKQQDTSIKRQSQLRELVKTERKAKEEIENSCKEEIKLRDTKIQELMQQLRVKTKHVENDPEEIQNFHEKTNQLETLLNQSKEEIKSHQEINAIIVAERDDLSQKLNEKQTVIDSMMKNHQSKNSDEDVSLLLKDKERLQEELESARLNIRQLESNLESVKQQQQQNYEDLLIKFNEKSIQYEDLRKNNQQLIEKLRNEIEILKENELEQQKLISKQHKDDDINEIKASLVKLQNDYDEVIANYTKKLDIQHQEHLEEILTIKNQQKVEINEENDCLKIQLDQHKKTIQQLEISLNEQTSKSNQYEQELKEKSLKIVQLENDFETLNKSSDELKITVKSNEQIINEKTEQLSSYKIKFDEQEAELNLLRDKIQKCELTEQEISEYQTEISTLKSEIISLMNVNEENTRRIDQYENEKFELEQDVFDKDRQIHERDEKIQEIELTLKQTQDRSTKLREALQKAKTSMKPNEQNDLDFRIQKLSEDYEQRLKDKEIEYNKNLKAMAKQMNTKIEENEYNYSKQIYELSHKNAKVENDLIMSAEKRANDADKRAYLAEAEMSKLQERIKEIQLEHHQNVQDLLSQIQKLTKQIVPTIERFSQTSIEDIYPNDGQHLLMFEPTEVDYLKQIVLAYMTGTDRLTMAKVICAVLRYNDNEKASIIEHEKLRQSRWINATR